MNAIKTTVLTNKADLLKDHIKNIGDGYQAVYQWNEQVGEDEYVRRIAIARTIGVSCKTEDEQLAIDCISKILNHIDGHIDGSIKAFLGDKILKIDVGDNRVAVFSYPILTEDGELVAREDFEAFIISDGDNFRKLEDFNDLF